MGYFWESVKHWQLLVRKEILETEVIQKFPVSVCR